MSELLDNATLEPVGEVKAVKRPDGSIVARGNVLAWLKAGRRDMLEKLGLTIGERTAVPPDKVSNGSTFERQPDGSVIEVHELTDRPPPEPDTRTAEEKIAEASGITVEELRGVIAGETSATAR